jgi:hypothetical protein
MNTNKNTARFIINFLNGTITGTKASFNKASKGAGPEYKELTEKIMAHPTFKLVVKEPKHTTTKEKKTYDGLNFKLMEDYIAIQENSEQDEKEYEAVKKTAKNAGRSVYPLTKKWFLKKYKDFDVEEAKAEISDAMIAKAAKIATPTVQEVPAAVAQVNVA